MFLKVRSYPNKEIEIVVDRSDTVESIKEFIEEQEGHPKNQQWLLFQDKMMEDDRTVADYKIDEGSIIHLVMPLNQDS